MKITLLKGILCFEFFKIFLKDHLRPIFPGWAGGKRFPVFVGSVCSRDSIRANASPCVIVDSARKTGHSKLVNATDAPVDIGTLITRSAGVKRGSPHIAGTGVLIRTIVRWHNTGLAPEEIAAKYGFLRLEQVH